jgi:hypothetical protein
MPSDTRLSPLSCWSPHTPGCVGVCHQIYTLVTLPNFFNLVESQCERGVVFPSAAYDKDIGRWVLVCL